MYQIVVNFSTILLKVIGSTGKFLNSKSIATQASFTTKFVKISVLKVYFRHFLTLLYNKARNRFSLFWFVAKQAIINQKLKEFAIDLQQITNTFTFVCIWLGKSHKTFIYRTHFQPIRCEYGVLVIAYPPKNHKLNTFNWTWKIYLCSYCACGIVVVFTTHENYVLHNPKRCRTALKELISVGI